MANIPAGTIIGYDASTGEQLFTENNRATRNPDQTYAMPKAGDLYEHQGKKYRVKGIRAGSNETLCLMDVVTER